MNVKIEEDIKAIRRMMEDSSRFLSLSGLSGIFAGIYALLGAGIAYFLILDGGQIRFDYSSNYILGGTNKDILIWLLIDALSVLILALGTAWLLSYNKSKRNNKPFWTKAAANMMLSLAIPLIAGFCLIVGMMLTGSTSLVASAMLIFYGLALVNAEKYTIGEIKYLGLFEILLGIVSIAFLGYGLYFWIVGFGLLHIIYGMLMWKKYK